MRGSLFGAVTLAALVSLMWPTAAQERRVALVIGNAAYKETPLKNPVNDARLFGARLKELGFEVVQRENASRDQMAAAVGEFSGRLREGDIALVYYAGHGVQSRGRNYLIPVDATVGTEGELRYQAIELTGLMEEIELARARVNIVVLDACRNNPFERRMRGGSRGLAAVDAARGTLIAYATAPGSVAADGDGANAPYTEELVKALAVPNLKAEDVFKRVTAAVEDRTRGAQTPWISSSLRGDFIFNMTVNVLTPTSESFAQADREALFWQSIQASTRRADFEAYLAQFPQGTFAGLARNRLEDLNKPQLAAVPTRSEVAIEPIDKDFVATQTARLREGPDVKAKQVGLLREGDSILVLGKVKDQAWYQVERKGEAAAAYVSAALLEEAATYRKRRAEEQQPPQQQQQQVPQQQAKLPAEPAPLDAIVPVPPPGHQQAMIAPAPAFPGGGAVPAPGRSFRDCPACPEMIVLPAGSVTIGSPPSEDGRDDDEEPLRSVAIRSFALGKHEVTRGEFAAFVRESGYAAGGNCFGYRGEKWEPTPGRDWRSPGFAQSERDPVVCVNWDDARAYVAWLSRKTGKTYRLPSEAEWEYAARAGSTSARHWGEDPAMACDYANVADRTAQASFPKWAVHECDDRRVHTAPVGTYGPNAFGLHDMLGNVWEWIEDCYNKSYDGSPRDGTAWSNGDCGNRVLRGGSWVSIPRSVRSASRVRDTTTVRSYSFGFRVARTE